MSILKRDPFDVTVSLQHQHQGCCHASMNSEGAPACKEQPAKIASEPIMSSDEAMSRAIETAVVKAVFGNSDLHRRRVLAAAGAGVVAEIVRDLFPFDTAKAMAMEVGAIEKPDLSIGFIPITCATPIIMAEPMGFYQKHGLNVKVRRASGWAMIRDWAITKEVDAAHMLSPMPLSITMGIGSPKVPFYMPAIENINGQAITLSNKHQGVKEAKDMKGFRFCVPFEFSMHNYLLRYYLAEGGLHPDKDVQIRVIPPPEMVANLKAGNVDGYLAPDPFNQRAVYENAGFIFKLSKEIWNGHPCCGFAVPQDFAHSCPNTFLALFRSILDATAYASDSTNRLETAQILSAERYLDQPVSVLEKVLLGQLANEDAKATIVPDRIDFDPMPWHSMAVWILTQMKRWKHIEAEFDYKRIAEEVYLATKCNQVLAEMGCTHRESTYRRHTIMGKVFDASRPQEYLDGFQIQSEA